MPVYVFDLQLTTAGGEAYGKQTWLTAHYPHAWRWGICSSVKGLDQKKGILGISEKKAYSGTTFYEADKVPEEDDDTTLLRLYAFRGGFLDAKDWKEGSTGTGYWVRLPNFGPNGDQPVRLARDFTWTIRRIDKD
jgi:hypothetical protein